jgi:hypothetical protein
MNLRCVSAVCLAFGWALLACVAEPASTQEVRLIGVVSVPPLQLAVLEIQRPYSFSPFVLEEGDSTEELKVIRIDPAAGSVTLRRDGTNLALRLELTGRAGMRGPPSLHLSSAPIHVFLQIYQRLSGRTVVRGASLPEHRPSILSDPGLDAQQASARIIESLRTNGIIVRPAGDLFAFAVSRADLELSLKIGMPPGVPATIEKSEAVPRNMVQFLKADLSQLLALHGELIDRAVVHADTFATLKVTVRNETSLTRTQCLWLVEALAFLQGVTVLPQGDNLAIAAPSSRMNKVRSLSSKPFLRDDDRVQAAKRLRVASDSAEQFLRLYCYLAEKEPGSIHSAVKQVRFGIPSTKPLTRRESIYALETVAALQNLELQDRGGKVALVPSGKMENRPQN